MKRNSTHLSDTCWYYEDANGLDIVIEYRDRDGSYVRTDIHRIPWSKLRSMLRWLDRWREVARR